MAHLDDESLALFALGDAVPDAHQREHLQTCSRCNAELTSLTRLVRVGRTSGDVEIEQPPAAVWSGIHSELGLSDGLADDPGERARMRPIAAVPDAPTTGAATTDAATTDEPDAVVTPMSRRRPTTTWWLVAAALVLGVVLGSLGWSLFVRPDDPRVLAEAVLEPFPDWPASGLARVVEGADGSREVVVDLSAPTGGLREVWLIDPETSGLVSLGLLSGTSGTFSIPADLDVSRYSVIDVSEEPDDGDPAHSGNSIVRGPLSSS